MELLHSLALGFEVAFTLHNLLSALFGVLLGTLVGALPGLGPVAAIAILLPAVHALDVTPALILLAGVYCGAQYGGATRAILIGAVGESSAVMRTVDGHPTDGHAMARAGRVGPAFGVASLGAFFAGCVGTLVIAAFARPLAAFAARFGPAEYFALLVLALVGAVVLASGSLLKAIAMGVLGLLLGLFASPGLLAQITTDVISSSLRWHVDIPDLGHGVGFVVIAIGLFGFGEIIANLGRPAARRALVKPGVNGLWPTRRDLQHAWPAVLRGTALGSIFGVLPGGGALLASSASYAVEKKLAGPGSRFGQGDIRGVAGPESAQHAGARTAFVPMLALGIPPNAAMALLLGAMAIKGVVPGPQVLTADPSLFWGLIASMWIGNAMLVILNLSLINIRIKLLSVPYRFVFPSITLLCCVGLYTLSHSAFDLYLAAGFALLGHVFRKLNCETAPLLLGFILGPMMEANLRRALLLSHGDWSTFVTQPLSAGLLACTALMIVMVLLPSISKQREATFQDV